MRIFILILCLLISIDAVSQSDYKDFLGKKSSIVYSKQYTFANLYDYKVNAKTEDSVVVDSYGYEIAEEGLFKKYSQLLQVNTADSVISKVILRAKLTLELDNKKHVFIKHKLVTGSQPSIFSITDFVNENGIWKENQNSNKELETIKSVFLLCTVNTLYAFFNKNDDPKQPEINKLKPLVKNEMGILDLKLLDSVIKKNRNQLAKYLE